MTPLLSAASECYNDIVGVLLTYGADPYICKMDPIMVSENFPHIACATLFTGKYKHHGLS